MTEITEQQSTWHTKLKALGPGILMASAAVGGSHIVSSTLWMGLTRSGYSCQCLQVSVLPFWCGIYRRYRKNFS